MAKKAVNVVPRLVAILSTLEVEERGKALQATLTLLGDTGKVTLPSGGGGGGAAGGGGGGGRGQSGAGMKAQEYFNLKNPYTKVEELAVAALYLEEHDNVLSVTKPQMVEVYKAARKSFDSGNYRRDLDNAKKAGFFTRGSGREASLSDYGQKFIQALPDRNAAKAVTRPKGGKRKGRGKKKKKEKA